ncbi:MAG TPA: RNA polymerase sigma-70 factor [Prevotella sp.]|nr:RNA polymerase sigma-70 factor [Prevotella sp.]
MDVMNEAQLIIELKMGSTHALEKIYDLYSARLYAFGLHYSKSREATQELVEDVFIWLWMNRKSIRQKESLRSILFIRLKHYLINAYRKTANSPQFRNYLDYLASVPTEAADSAIEYDEFVKKLNLAISQLPSTQQKVVRLVKFEAFRIEDVARQLNLTEQTVRNQLYLGLKQLKQALGVYYILLEFLFFVNT